MLTRADRTVWDHVRRSVTPLGSPEPGRPRPFTRIEISTRVDLHGDTVHDAYLRVRDVVERLRDRHVPEVVVVTGRSGAINAEFAVWAAAHPDIVSLEPLRGGGAYRIRVRPRGPRTATCRR